MRIRSVSRPERFNICRCGSCIWKFELVDNPCVLCLAHGQRASIRSTALSLISAASTTSVRSTSHLLPGLLVFKHPRVSALQLTKPTPRLRSFLPLTFTSLLLPSPLKPLPALPHHAFPIGVVRRPCPRPWSLALSQLFYPPCPATKQLPRSRVKTGLTSTPPLPASFADSGYRSCSCLARRSSKAAA